MANAKKASGEEALVGKFFHTFKMKEDGTSDYVEYQGVINAYVSDGIYLVAKFNWILGDSWAESLMSLDYFANHDARFYDTSEEMKNAYDYGPGYPKYEHKIRD